MSSDFGVAEDPTQPFTCPECGDTATRGAFAEADYSCRACNLTVAHVDVAATGAVREVFGWLLSPGHMLLDRYRVVSLLGRGGFAATYGVEDTRLANRRCALKEVPQLLFDRGEMEILSRLHHPGIPNIKDTFEDNGMVYLVLEFGGSRSLAAERYERGGKIPIDVLLPWITQLCEVLRYLHSQKPPIVHRDLKPGNILLNEHGRINLIDFGIAKETEGAGSQTRTIARSASHGYSPPEQVMGTGTDQRSDVYALGATLYILLTGKRPPAAHDRVAGEEMPSPRSIVPEVSAELDDLIVRSLELNINRRVQSIGEFEYELNAIISGEPLPKAAASGGTVRVDQSAVGGGTPVADQGSTFAMPEDVATVHLERGAADRSRSFPAMWAVAAAVGVVAIAGAVWWSQRSGEPVDAASTEQAGSVEPGAAAGTAGSAQPVAPTPAGSPTPASSLAGTPTDDPAPTESSGSALDILKARAAEPPAESPPPEPDAAPPRRTTAPAFTQPPPRDVEPAPVRRSPPPRQNAGPPAGEPDWGAGFKKGSTRRVD